MREIPRHSDLRGTPCVPTIGCMDKDLDIPGDEIDLSGKLLIAMPGMGDPRFAKSVVLVCRHSGEGAMGLIVNKPLGDLSFPDLLEELGIEGADGASSPPIRFGGPVENARGFVLHSLDYSRSEGTIEVPGGYGMTATIDILKDIAQGHGPARSMLALGYSGWGPGQLEAELARNGWLTCEATEEIVFTAEDDEKWRLALAELGIDALTLSAAAGRA